MPNPNQLFRHISIWHETFKLQLMCNAIRILTICSHQLWVLHSWYSYSLLKYNWEYILAPYVLHFIYFTCESSDPAVIIDKSWWTVRLTQLRSGFWLSVCFPVIDIHINFIVKHQRNDTYVILQYTTTLLSLNKQVVKLKWKKSLFIVYDLIHFHFSLTKSTSQIFI